MKSEGWRKKKFLKRGGGGETKKKKRRETNTRGEREREQNCWMRHTRRRRFKCVVDALHGSRWRERERVGMHNAAVKRKTICLDEVKEADKWRDKLEESEVTWIVCLHALEESRGAGQGCNRDFTIEKEGEREREVSECDYMHVPVWFHWGKRTLFFSTFFDYLGKNWKDARLCRFTNHLVTYCEARFALGQWVRPSTEGESPAKLTDG